MSKEDLMDPPLYDMLHVKFRGDNHEVILPYCEVANGNVAEISDSAIEITKPQDKVQMDFKVFVEVIENTFDIKQIVKLSVQKAGSYESVQLL